MDFSQNAILTNECRVEYLKSLKGRIQKDYDRLQIAKKLYSQDLDKEGGDGFIRNIEEDLNYSMMLYVGIKRLSDEFMEDYSKIGHDEEMSKMFRVEIERWV